MVRSALVLAAFAALTSTLAAPLAERAGAPANYKQDPALVRNTDGSKLCMVPDGGPGTNITDPYTAFGFNGKPLDFTDVFDITHRDLTLEATVMAMTWRDPTWPLARIALPCGEIRDVPRQSPTVILTPKGGDDFVSTVHREDLPADDRVISNWWPAAIEQAFFNYGAEVEGRYDFLGDSSNSPDIYLQMLSGYETTVLTNDGSDLDALAAEWHPIIQKSRDTPVIVTTKSDANYLDLRANETYVVRQGKFPNNVLLFSPLGNGPSDSVYAGDYTALLASLDKLVYFTNFERGPNSV